jgi:Ca2+-binding EF-hand superfamily protein
MNVQFRAFDKDDEGNILVDEIRNTLVFVGIFTEQEVDEMIAYIDTDSNGKINYEGFFLFIFTV